LQKIKFSSFKIQKKLKNKFFTLIIFFLKKKKKKRRINSNRQA